MRNTLVNTTRNMAPVAMLLNAF